MLLDTREREREANANRVARVAARPAPAVRVAPVPPAPPQLPLLPRGRGLSPQELFGRGLFGPPVHDPPEPPRPAVQNLGFDDGGDFDWIDNPRTYAQFTTAFATLIQS